MPILNRSYPSLRYDCLLLFGTTGGVSMADVLVVYALLFRLLLRTLANLRVRQTQVRQVSFIEIYMCSTWDRFVSRLDCTEAQFSFIAIHMVSTIAPSFWSTTVSQESGDWMSIDCLLLKIPYLQIELRILVALLTMGSTVWSSFNNLRAVSQGGCGRNFSSVAVRRRSLSTSEKCLSLCRS